MPISASAQAIAPWLVRVFITAWPAVTTPTAWINEAATATTLQRSTWGMRRWAYLRDYGVRFDFDQHLRIDERLDLDHRGSGLVGPEEFAVSSPVIRPPRDVGDEHPGSHHVFSARAELAERALDELEASQRLGVSISGFVHAGPCLINRSRSSNINVVACFESAAIAHFVFPGGFRKHAFEIHTVESSTAGGRARI